MARRKRKIRRYDEDLFKDTTMTFGEHLEELRRCLFKAIIGLVLGFIVGLTIGWEVVDFIQEPLRDSLEEFYGQQAREKLQAKIEELRAAGRPVPDDFSRYEQLIDKDHLTFEEMYVDPAELLDSLKQSYPGQFEGIKLETGDPDGVSRKDNLVQVFFWHPIRDEVRVTSLSGHEPFVVYIKASLLVGAILASPWIFYQIWSFVAAGLYPHEKNFVHVFLPFSIALFLAGAALAFFVVIKYVLNFLFMFNRWMGIVPDIRISEWLGFVVMLPLGFGISFQLPLVMLFLERIGIFTVDSYLSKWRMAILVICVMSMLLTPSDPQSMLLMAVPLTVLYFGGILMCRFMPRNASPFDDEEDEERPAAPKRKAVEASDSGQAGEATTPTDSAEEPNSAEKPGDAVEPDDADGSGDAEEPDDGK